MSLPIPISRAVMQGLKSQKEEEVRQARIKSIVQEIYKEAVQVAEKTADSSYNHEIPSVQMAPNPISYRNQIKSDYLRQRQQQMLSNRNNPTPFQHQYTQGGPDPFHIKNIPDILAGLRNLFPDCALSHTLLCQAKDGKMYDIAKLDDAVLPFVDHALDQSYIVIDWS